MTAASNWYVLTGAPSSGKSTLIAELAKLGYATTEEFGRKLIDTELASGKSLAEVEVDSAAFELAWIKLQVEREQQLDRTHATFFDRGILDTLAYFRHYGWPIPDEVASLCAEASYKKVFLVELLDYEQDYARIEGAETAAQMQELFAQVYTGAGYEVVRIPKDTIEKRLTNILGHI
jgi:predicted ATPase